MNFQGTSCKRFVFSIHVRLDNFLRTLNNYFHEQRFFCLLMMYYVFLIFRVVYATVKSQSRISRLVKRNHQFGKRQAREEYDN